MNEDLTRTAPAWDEIHGLVGTQFGVLVEDARSDMETIRILQEGLEEKKIQIQDLLTRCKTPSVQVGLSRVTVVEGRKPSEKLDTQKLLALGVAMSTLQAATVRGAPGKPWVKITTREETAE